MTCSRSGMPCKRTRGLGAPPDTDAIRLPLPAARIRHSLTVVTVGPPWRIGVFRKEALRTKERPWCDSWLQQLLSGHYGVVGCVHRLGRVIEILDVHVRDAKNMGFRDPLRRAGKPERAIFLVDLHEMRALGPERRVLCRLALCAGQRVILRVHPDAAAK